MIKRGVLLETRRHIFEPVLGDDAGGYLCGIKGCGLSSTREREIKCKNELKKSAFYTQSIVEMFQLNKIKSDFLLILYAHLIYSSKVHFINW